MKSADIPKIDALPELAKRKKPENTRFVKSLKKKKPAGLDLIVHALHDEIFTELDCLKCANCCKTISPIITYRDINQIAKELKIKPGEFIQTYLEMDEEGDFVFKQTPCPFLQSDNYCSVYSSRPKACREYPHTNRKNFAQILDLSLKNTMVCPAVYAVFEKLKSKLA